MKPCEQCHKDWAEPGMDLCTRCLWAAAKLAGPWAESIVYRDTTQEVKPLLKESA